MTNRNDSTERSGWPDRDLSFSPPGCRRSRIPQTPRPSRDSLQGMNPRRQVQRLDNHSPSMAEDGTDDSNNDRKRSATAFLSAADLLGNFRPPERPPIFKVEPTEPDIMSLPLRSSREPKVDRPSIYAMKPRKRANLSKAMAGRGKKNLGQDHGEDEETENVHQDGTIVDLTGDDNAEEAQSPQRDDNTTVQRKGRTLQGVLFMPVTSATNSKIPDATLQHIRDRHGQDHISLPRNITNWRQLEEFAGANSKPSLVTPAFISHLRNASSSNGIPQASSGVLSQHNSSFFREVNPEPPNRSLFPAQVASPASFAHGLAPISGTHLQSADSRTPSRTINDNVSDTNILPSSDVRTPSSRLSNNYDPPLTRLRPRTNSIPQGSNNAQLNREIHNLSDNNLPASITVDINALLQPSENLSHLLPSSAPPDRPHLVSLWHPYLLKLPKGQHSHLDLVDTAVSIMSRYDMKEQSVIKAFLDMNEVQHFFFLFKSRTSAWHSWSIEREYNVVTIGLERNNRAANTTESQRPSSGQFDVTVQYRIDPPTSATFDNTATSTIDSPDAATPVTTITKDTPSNHNEPSLPPPISDNDQSSPSPAPTQARNTIPGAWHLHGTTIFPSQPPLPIFLWSTPPNRGADEVSRYLHPAQSHILPPSHLSMLARYLQHTAFTCTAMEAEFQVVWGRKVRYDSVLGRVRATYDHALKGAKTQAEKRKRGEYNRPVGKSGLRAVKNAAADDEVAKQGAGPKPGAGEALDWLAGRDNNVSMNMSETENAVETPIDGNTTALAAVLAGRTGSTSARSGLSLRERTRRALMNDLAANAPTTSASDSGSNPYHLTTIKPERSRKRLKREDRGDASGSEYSDSGSGEE